MIYLDMDEVICDFLGKLLTVYNSMYCKNVKKEDIEGWSLKQYIGEEGIRLFNKPGFFADLEPVDNALATIQFLQYEGREVFIISSPANEYSVFDKYLWVKKHLPFFPIGNLILVGDKGKLLSQIDKGFLFDDCPKYLESFGGVSVCMDMPYNKEAKCDHRVSSWEEFYEVVK